MRKKPFVYIVESPSPTDLFDGRTEGRALCEALQAIGYNFSYVLAASPDQFGRAFLTGPDSHLAAEVQKYGGVAPILHLSMHGNNEGVALTDGTHVPWRVLSKLLAPLHKRLPHGLAICMSACGGASGIRMAMSEDEDEKPFYALVGTFESIPWDDALVGFITFYHCWARGLSLKDSVDRMNMASTHNGFAAYFGAEQKQKYLDAIQQRRLIESILQTPPSGDMPRGLLDWFAENTHQADDPAHIQAPAK